MWDLFCGLGGWSQAFRDAGWRVITVDNDPMFKPEVLCDISELDVSGQPAPDFLTASPPCVEFALRRFDPKIKPSLDLVVAAKRVIDELKPKYWVIENVRHAVPFISEILGPHRLAVGPYFLWGNFPLFLPQSVKGKSGVRGPHWLRSATRAKIPYPLSSDMERAVSYVFNASRSPAITPELEAHDSPRCL